MNGFRRSFPCCLAALALSACATAQPLASASERDAISATLMRDMTILSSDTFAGRAPGGEGEQRTTAFIVEELQAAGLVSGSGDPERPWRQPVPLIADGPEGMGLTLYPGDETAGENDGATDDSDDHEELRPFVSDNVIGLLPGRVTDAGAVLMLAHWDHLGICGPDGPDDRICNGAVDNASGIAILLELTRRLAASGPHDRDIYVLATTAEEAGLLGARAFVKAPPVPLDTFVAAFNLDTMAVAPAGSPVGIVGEGRTALDEVIHEILREAGREPGDRDFAESFVQRQDGWALLREGVPAVLLSSTFGSRDLANRYFDNDYHSPSDEIGAIELGGAIDDLLLHERLIRHIASADRYAAPGGVLAKGAGD